MEVIVYVARSVPFFGFVFLCWLFGVLFLESLPTVWQTPYIRVNTQMNTKNTLPYTTKMYTKATENSRQSNNFYLLIYII